MSGLYVLLVVLAAPGPVSGSSGSGQRVDRSGSVEPLQVLESGGAWLVDAITPDGRQEDRQQWRSAESPRHAVLSFMQGMALSREGRGGWDQASLALPAGEPAALRGAAEALYDVLLRLGPIEPIDLPHAGGLKDGQSRYELFPRGIDHQWVWQAIDGAPAGSVVLVRGGDGAWRFDPGTLAGAERLAASLAGIPPWYDEAHAKALFLDVFRPTVERTPWWGWLAAVGVWVVAVLVGWLGRRRLRRVDVDARPVEIAVHSLGTPLLLLMVTLAAVFGSLFLHFGPVLSGFRWTVIQMLGLLTVVWFVFGLADLGALAYRTWFGQDNPYHAMALTVVRRVLRIVVFVLVVLFVLENVFNFRVGALLGSLGLIGLALSLAGKDAAKNLFGALVVFFTRPFVVNDWIEFEGYLGVVEDVGVQATKLRLLSGELVTVPNMKFVDRPVENLSKRQEIRRKMELALPYGTAPGKVEEAVAAVYAVLESDEIAGDGSFDLEARPPEVAFTGFEADHLEVTVYYWYQMGGKGEMQRDVDRGWYTYLHHCTAVNQALMRKFEEIGVSFAFPTQTVRLARASGGDGVGGIGGG